MSNCIACGSMMFGNNVNDKLCESCYNSRISQVCKKDTNEMDKILELCDVMPIDDSIKHVMGDEYIPSPILRDVIGRSLRM